MEELDEFGIPIKKTSTPQSAKIEMDEFGIPLKKKEPAIGLGYEKPSEALRMGGLPKQEKLSQSPLKTAAITTPSVSTKKQWTQQDQKSLIEKIKTGDLTGQTPEEDDYLSRIGSRIVRGMNTLNYNLSKTPEFVYNLAAYPQNVIAETFDIPALAVSADKVKKELGIQNEVADYYKDQINQLASLDDKYMGANGSVTNLAKEGKYLDAAKLLGEQIAESLPTTAAIAASGGLGASSTAITLGGGAVFGAAKYDELADRTDLTESQKTSISFATGLTEGLFENLGTGNIGRIVKDVITKQGAAKGKEVAKGMFITAYKDALKKYMPVSGALQGGIEEAATTFAQNAIDIYTGVDPQKKLSDGLIDAFAVGTGSDFIISSPVLLSKDRNKKVAEKQVEVDEIDSEINNPNLSDDAKATLSQKRGKIMSDINDVIDEDVNEQRALPDATKREIEQIQDGLEQIGIDIENTKSEFAKKELESKRVELESRIDELTKAGTTTTDGERTIEGAVSAGTDVLETGVGMAAEPGKEGVAGEDIQAEEVLATEKPTPTKLNVLGESVNMYNNYIPSRIEDVEADAMYSFSSDSKDGIPSLLQDKAYANSLTVNGVKKENWNASISGNELLKLFPKKTTEAATQAPLEEQQVPEEITNEYLLKTLPEEKSEGNTGKVMITTDKFGSTKTRYIPFEIIEQANKNDKLGGQTAKEINDRGGYSDKELDRKLPNWRTMLSKPEVVSEKVTEVTAPEIEVTPTAGSVGEEVEAKRKETEAKIKRKDLFIGVGEFSSELGGSDKAAVPVSHKEKNGIEFVEYAHPETGSVDVIVTGKSDNDFVGFYRIYENGKPTNKWSSKFENQSRNKEDFKTMISGVQEMLPEGHEYTETTSISTDGLRIWEQQLSRGYELQYDKNGKLITNLVAINGDAIVNELGIPVQKGEFENIRVKSKEEFEIVKKALLPYLEKLGLNENDVKWYTGTVKINLPVLKSTKEQPKAETKPTETAKVEPVKKAAKTEVKDGVTELFKAIPELSDIGSQQEYTKYLDTIFPNSKIKDILYHKTSSKEIEGGKFRVSRLGGVYFSFLDISTGGLLKGVVQKLINEKTVFAVVNIKNPFIVNRKNYKEVENKTGVSTQNVNMTKKYYDLSNNDAILGYANPLKDKGELDDFPNTNLSENGKHVELAVINPDNIHILGSKQDLDGFKKFTSKNTETAKETAKPAKSERKAIAEAKIDDLAAKAKEFLRNKNLPEGTKVSGVSQDKVIDILASTVKALVNSGIEISEAIKQVREYFEADYDTSAVKDYQIAQKIARDELTDVAKENGFSSYREAVFAVNKYVREVGKEDVITKEEIEKAAKEKTKSEEEAKKAKTSEKKGYTGRKKVSKFYKTALAYVQNTPTRLQDFLKANPLSYGVVTNAESIKKAIDFIEENGFEETLKDFLTKQIKTDGEFEKIIFVGYLLRGGLSEAFTDISKSMNGVTDADELAALKKEADRIFNDMKAVTTLLAEGYFPSFGRAIQAGALFAQDLSTEDGAIFHFTKLTEQAAAKAREVNKQEATEQVNTVKEVVEEGTAKAAKQVTEYIVKSKDVQARNATKLSKARKAASDAREKLKAALAKYKILGIANDPWEQAKNDVATIKALTDYVAAQLKYKSVQAGQVIKEVAALLGINPRYIPKVDIQEIMDAAKVQAEKDMTFDEITSATTPKGVAYAERVGKELSNDPSAINKTVESIIQDYYMGNQTLDEIIDMVKQRFDVTDAQAITIAKQIQISINDNITKALEKQLDRKIKQLNDKRLKEEGKKPPKERKPVKSLYDIMAQAQVMGVLDTDSVQAILEELYNVPTVTPEDIQFVKDTYAKINNTGDLTRKAQLIADLHKRFAGKNPVLFYDVYNSYWYSAVLSGPSTTDVNAAYGFVVTALAIQDVISGAFINSVKIIADKFKGKQNPSSVALEARLIFDSMWRTVFQTGTLNIDAIKRGALSKMESLPLYESFQNLVSTLKRGPQAFNEELRNTEVSAKDNAYLKDYKPQGLGKLISPLVWIDKKTGIFSFLPKYVPRAINAVDIFFGTALKNLNLAQTLKTYYVQQGLSGKDLAKAIRSDLNKSPELLLAARELAANDRLNIDLEVKQENGEFVVYDTGKKQKSFKTKSAANKYMTELSYQGDKYQKGVVDYLNATLPPDVIDATRRIAAQYVCTGDVEGARSKWFYNNIILNIRKATMDWADSKEQSKFTRAIKFATSRVVEFMKFPLNFNNLAIAYTPALAFMRAKYTGDEASLYAQVYKDKAQQRFLTGFAAFMALTTPTLLSMLVLKSPDDEEEENKEDLKRRQELADKFFKDTGEKIDIDNPLFNLPKDGELTGSLSFLPANTKKFLKENNLAVPFRRWNAKLNIWEDYTISPLVYNLTMAASLADYVKYVINDKTKFNSVAQRAKEWQNVASYFAGNLVQTFVNAAGVKSQNQLLLTLNSNNYERKINAAVDMLFSPVQSTPALLRQLSDGLDMRLKQRVESVDKPFEYVASKTIPLGSLFYTGRKKHDMFGDEIAYLTGADRGFVLKHLFAVTQKDYEKKRTELGQFLNINGYSKYRDMITEYEKKNTEIIDIKNPTVEINGIAYTNYLDKGFTDDEMYEIGLAAAKRAKQILISNKATLQKIGNATDLNNIPLVSANYTIPFTESIDFIYDTIFKEEWESALVKKKYVSEVGENVYEANKTTSTIITDMLNVILTKTPVEKVKPVETKIPIEFNDFNEGD